MPGLNNALFLFFLSFLSIQALAAPAASKQALADDQLVSRSSYPFNRMVAFGDNLSDNGNGSVAHHVAQPGQPDNTIYGDRTWTNGPVAVSYLSDSLGGLYLRDLAFGHASGGSKFGATIDNDYTQSTANAPSSKDQIASYVSDTQGNPADALHFLWIGANDINLYHIMSWFETNHVFGNEFAPMLAKQVQTLLDAGAQYVFVPNLYPKQISPSKAFYCSNPQEQQNFGAAIEYANEQIAEEMNKFGDHVIQYDVYNFMMYLWDNAAAYGFTHVGGEFCDGYSQQDWDLCMVQDHGDEFYWQQYLDPTTAVHKLIANDMLRVINQHFDI